MTRRIATVLLLLIVLTGAGLRSYHLTSRSLWFDEAFSWRLTEFPLSEMIARDAADVHPPLYYIVLEGWTTVFGSSLLALRSLSIVLAAVSLAAVYLFTATIAPRRPRSTALLATLFTALSAYQIQYAWEARMYPLGIVLALLSSWLLVKALRDPPRLSYWIGYAVTAAAFAYVHYYAFFSLAAHALVAAGYVLIRTRGRIGEMLQWRLVWYGLTAAALAILLYLPWLGVVLNQNAQVQESYWVPTIRGWVIPDTFYRMLWLRLTIPHDIEPLTLIVAALPITFILSVWLALLFLARRTPAGKQLGVILVVALGAVPFLLSIAVSLVGQSIYQDRFFAFAHVFVLIALALAVSFIRPPGIRRAIAALLALMFMANSYAWWQELSIPDKPGLAAAAAHVYREAEPSTPVVVSSSFIYYAFRFYAEERHAAPTLPRLYTESGQLSHFAGGPIATDDDAIGPGVFALHNTIWIVDTTGFGASPLNPPADWQLAEQHTYPEVFPHQGDIIINRYTKTTSN